MKRILLSLLILTPAFLRGEIVPTGLGFAVTRQGHIVTAYHLVAGRDRVTLRQGGKDFEAAVLSYDEKRDIALLHSGETSGSYLQIAVSSSLGSGNRVRLFGFLETESTLTSPGVYAGDIGTVEQNGGQRLFAGPIALNPRSAGGPVLNEDGQAVAMVSTQPPPGCQIQVNQLLASVDYARSLLRHEGVEPPNRASYDPPAACLVIVLGESTAELSVTARTHAGFVQNAVTTTLITESPSREPLDKFLDRLASKGKFRIAMSRTLLGRIRHTGKYVNHPMRAVFSDIEFQHTLRCTVTASGIVRVDLALDKDTAEAVRLVETERLERERGPALQSLLRKDRDWQPAIYRDLARYSVAVAPLVETWEMTRDASTFNASTLVSADVVAAEKAFVEQSPEEARMRLAAARLALEENYHRREYSYYDYDRKERVDRWPALLKGSGVEVDVERYEDAHATLVWNKKAALDLVAANIWKVTNIGKHETIRFSDPELNAQLDGYLKNMDVRIDNPEAPATDGVFELAK